MINLRFPYVDGLLIKDRKNRFSRGLLALQKISGCFEIVV